MLKKNIVFFIGARAGSKGLKNKNIKLIAGKPLIFWSIQAAIKSKYCKNLIISTDSRKISSYAKKVSKKIIIIKRPKKLATDYSGKFDAWKHALSFYEKTFHEKVDYLFDLDCTNPLKYITDIESMIHLANNTKFRFDAIVTIGNSRKNPYFNMLEKKSNFYNICKPLKYWPKRRQDAPKIFDQVASMYLIKSSFINRSKNLYQGKLLGFLVKDYQIYDVDSKLDFEIIKFLFNKYNFKRELI